MTSQTTIPAATVLISGHLLRETAKAIQVRTLYSDVWLPKSLCSRTEIEIGSIGGTLSTFSVPAWLVSKHNLDRSVVAGEVDE